MIQNLMLNNNIIYHKSFLAVLQYMGYTIGELSETEQG